MKKLNSFLFVLLLSTIIFLPSCNDSDIFENTQNEIENMHRKGSLRIKKSKFNLDENDAKNVAKMFKSSDNTRSIYSDPISIVPIKDENGEVKIFGVNFLDGYMFVSASKNYFPVLAMIDHGTYKTENDNGGEKFLIEEMLAAINSTELSEETKTRIAGEWRKFEEIPAPAITRADFGFDDDAYEEALYVLSDDWWERAEGRVYKLTESKEYFTDAEYNSYCSRAEGEWDDLFGGTKFSWENTAMIAIVDHYEDDYKGPLLKTKWHQDMGYSYLDYPLGCITIAVGQTMNFFKYPQNAYNWSMMENNEINNEISKFLTDLKSKLKINENGEGYISDAVSVLQSYGYNCSLNTHNSNASSGSVRSNKPVIQCGVAPGKTVGHAWVCDGVSYIQDYTEYHLVGLGYSDFHKVYTYVEYESNNNKIEWYDRGTTYFHMNWGWGGSGDGWYLDTLVDAPVYYSNNRWDLIISSLR